jgi:hypothetical protein
MYLLCVQILDKNSFVWKFYKMCFLVEGPGGQGVRHGKKDTFETDRFSVGLSAISALARDGNCLGVLK